MSCLRGCRRARWLGFPESACANGSPRSPFRRSLTSPKATGESSTATLIDWSRPMPDSIELASDDELITELLGRFDHAAFTGMRIETEDVITKTGGHSVLRKWKGNSYTVAGLAAHVG